MSPALKDGDYVLTLKPRLFRPGFIYVINHIDLGRIIKRLDRAEGDRIWVSGDNPASTPGAIIAQVTKDRVIGRAVLAITTSGIKRI